MPALQARILVIICLTLAVSLAARPARCEMAGYEVEIPALPDGLTALLASVSDCVNLRDNPPDSMGLLRSRMNNDLQAFSTALKSRGYFKAELEGTLDAKATPRRIRFQATPGPRFVFARPELILHPDNTALREQLRTVLEGVRQGTGYASSAVLDTETALLERLKELGYPSPSAAGRDVVADHAANTVDVRFRISTGSRAAFGRTEITGLDSVSGEFVVARLAWEEGIPYDRGLVDRTREELVRSGLFRSVSIETVHRPDSDTAEIRIAVLEAPHRTVRSGLWYYSDLGPGAGLGWTHRNFLGGGQELRLLTELSENLQLAESSFILPNLGGPGQTLGLSARYGHEHTDVYETTNLSLSGIMRQPLADLQVGYGLAYRLARVHNEGKRRFNLLSVPLITEYSSADHPLDPTSGLTLALRMEPFTDLEARSTSFVLWNLSGRHYLPLREDKSLILATRGRYSMLAGTSRESIPEDMLLYAGGGGSVRGYAHQYAGQLDEDRKPLGGVSAVDFSVELRWRYSRTLGFVLFGDGGGAFSGRNPSEAEQYFWGMGAGIRYFTPVGPIRMDVAVPLERRGGVDDPFQVSVSLGQAF